MLSNIANARLQIVTLSLDYDVHDLPTIILCAILTTISRRSINIHQVKIKLTHDRHTAFTYTPGVHIPIHGYSSLKISSWSRKFIQSQSHFLFSASNLAKYRDHVTARHSACVLRWIRSSATDVIIFFNFMSYTPTHPRGLAHLIHAYCVKD